MPHNFFITGMPKTGKTGLLRRIVEDLRKQGLRVGGFLSPEELHHGTRNAFQVEDLATGKRGLLADVSADGPKVSKYHVEIASFESVAIPIMEEFSRYDVFVIDEIGPMELKSSRFAELLDSLFESQTPLIASLHESLVGHYGSYGEVFYLEKNNREDIYDQLVEKIRLARYSRRPEVARKKPAVAKKPTKAKVRKAKPSRPAKKLVKKKKAKAKKKRKGVLKNIRNLLGF